MPIKLNSFILPEEVTKKMETDLNESILTEIELGFALCTKPNSNIIADRNHCKGNECGIYIGRKCDPEEKPIGSYHTHPGDFTRMTASDMQGACIEDVNCIGGTVPKQVKCFVRKKFEPDWKDKAKQIGCNSISREYSEKYEKPLNEHFIDLKIRNDILKNLRYKAIEKLEFSEELNKKIAEHNREVEEYKNTIYTYERKLKELTDKYFKEVTIS